MAMDFGAAALNRAELIQIALAYQALEKKQLKAKFAAPGGLYEFTKYFWHVLEPVTKFVDGWALQALCLHLEAVSRGEITRILINVPPGFAKSLTLNVFWPAYEWGALGRPDLRYVAFSYSSTLTERDNEKFLYLISSPEYQALFGKHVQVTKEGVGRVANTARGWKFASSVGGVGTGERGDRILCFPYETAILTDAGSIPIGEIVSRRMDVKIAGFNHAIGQVEWQPIEQHQQSRSADLVEIIHEGGSFRCTADHPVFVSGRGYTEAAKARVGDSLRILRKGIPAQDEPSAKDLLTELQGQASLEKEQGRQQQALHSLRDIGLSPTRSYGEIRERLLQSYVSWRSQRRGEQSGLSDWPRYQELRELRRRIFVQGRRGAASHLLFNVLRIFSEVAKQSPQAFAEIMRRMRGRIQTIHSQISVLFQKMCERLSCPPHSWREQWTLCSWSSPSEISNALAQRAQTRYQNARWLQMPSVWGDGNETSPSCPSYQLRQRRFERDEPDNGLQVLPWQDAWQNSKSNGLAEAAILSVKRVTSIEDTFNLSVAPYHNYYADGVLVHNCDDAHKVSEAESEIVREDTTRWFRESMQNRLNDLAKGVIVVLGQRVNEADVSGVILEEYPDYEHLCIPMEYDGRDVDKDGQKLQTSIGWSDPRELDGDLAWPERYPDSVLGPYRTRPYLWAGQYQQSPEPRGGGIIKRDYWRIWNAEAQHANDVKPGLFPEFEFILASFDGAFTEKKENDYSALVIIGAWVETNEEQRFNEHFGTPRLMLMHAWHKRVTLHGRTEIAIRPSESKEEFSERRKLDWGVVEHIAADCKKYKVDKLIIENKASGITVEQEMRRLFSRENWTVALHDPGKLDKVGRAYTVQHLFADGLIWRPETDWAQLVEDELASLPRGAHDDLADAMINGIIHLRRMLLAQRKDESHAAIENMLFPPAPPRPRPHYES